MRNYFFIWPGGTQSASLRSKPDGHGAVGGYRFKPGALAVPGSGILAEVPAVEGFDRDVPALVLLDCVVADVIGRGMGTVWRPGAARAPTGGMLADIPAIEGLAPDVPALVLLVDCAIASVASKPASNAA